MQNEETEIHLRDYLRVISKRKQIVAVFFLTTLVVVLIGTLVSTPLYTATLRLKVEQKNEDPLNNIYRYIRQDPEFINSQIQILSSQSVMEKVVAMLNLVETYPHYFPEKNRGFSIVGFLKGLFAIPEHPVLSQDAQGPRPMSPAERLAKDMLEGLEVEHIRDSQILEVSYTSENPAFSTLVCNTIPRAYIEQLLEMKMKNSEYTIDWMKKKAASERKKLEKSEHSLQDYLTAQDIVTIENRIAIIPEKLSQISSELTKAETKMEELESVIDQINRIPKDELETIPAIASEGSLQAIRSQIREAEQKIMTLSQKYGPKHPVRIQAQNTLNELNAKKAAEIQTIVQRIKNDFQLAVANYKNLKQQLENTKAEAARLNEKSIQYNILKREIDTKKELYNALVARIKEQTLTRQFRDVDVYVVGEAKLPEQPSNQNLPRNLLLAMVLGCMGGVGSAFFLEYLDNTISTAEDAEEKTGVPAIAAIPLIDSEEKDPHTVVIDHPASPEAEAYKAARTALSLSTPSGYPGSIVVTSIYPGEGKTVTSINLGAAIAQAERRVLLIDSDMRKPSLHNIFDTDSKPGFSELLTGQCEPADAIRETGTAGLDLLPCGEKPPNPSDLLSSSRAKEIINSLGKTYDVIIIDTPPLANLSDALALTLCTDRTIVVTRSKKTRYEDVKREAKRLGEAGNKLLGQVVNAIDLEREGYYYYGSYHRYTEYYS